MAKSVMSVALPDDARIMNIHSLTTANMEAAIRPRKHDVADK